jgi:hypothetical protein
MSATTGIAAVRSTWPADQYCAFLLDSIEGSGLISTAMDFVSSLRGE